MKNLKQLALIVVALIAIGFLDVKAQETVVIRTLETQVKLMGDTEIVTVTPDGRVEQTPLVKGPIPKVMKENSILIQNEIAKWRNQGFRTVSATAAAHENFLVTTYILEK